MNAKRIGAARVRLLRLFPIVATYLCIISPDSFAQGTVQIKDVSFCKAGGYELFLDLAIPTGSKGPFPAILFLCGNSWGDYTSIDRPRLARGKRIDAGYVGVAADCRSIAEKENGKSKYPFPAQVNDVKCAVRWMRENAAKYHIDVQRVGVVGWSSGGNLALMLGMTKTSDGLEGNDIKKQFSSAVTAVVEFGAPTDLIRHYQDAERQIPHDELDSIVSYIGGPPKDMQDRYYKSSPINYVSENVPPILILHGDADSSVSIKQSELLDAKLTSVGAVHKLVVMKGYGHQNFWNEDVVWEFLAQQLLRK